ncbi:MAG: outer membrane beta-barrel domain-containing protein [Deltaproteobacteria bacterium]|nr:outer membrane beta-barrel domain-containing protein [Deltaproteobacteria bacterium]
MGSYNLASFMLAAALIATPVAISAADQPSTREIEERAADQPSTREIEERAADQETGTNLEEGEEAPRTLAERIPSVTRRSFVKQNRLELFPSAGLSLNDPFYDHIIGSLGFAYHVFEYLSVGITGDYFGSIKSKIPVEGRLGNPTINIERPLYSGHLEVGFTPFYGKLSLLAESVLHFDIYAIVGGGMIARKRGGTTFAGVLGVGEHFFLNEWAALRVEIRDQIFMMGRNNAEPKNDSMQNLLIVTLGLSIFIPPTFEHERL